MTAEKEEPDGVLSSKRIAEVARQAASAQRDGMAVIDDCDGQTIDALIERVRQLESDQRAEALDL